MPLTTVAGTDKTQTHGTQEWHLGAVIVVYTHWAAGTGCQTDQYCCSCRCRTALMLATEANAVSVVDVLLQQKASLSVTDSQGQDVMYYAKLAGHSEVKAALMAALNKQQTAGEFR